MQHNTNIIKIMPSAKVYYDRAMKAFEKRNLEKAINHFKTGVSLAENKQEEIFGCVQIALMMQHMQNFQESIALFNDLLEKTQNTYPELYYFQATNYVHVEDFESALSLAEFYLDMTPRGTHIKEAEQMKEMLKERLS